MQEAIPYGGGRGWAMPSGAVNETTSNRAVLDGAFESPSPSPSPSSSVSTAGGEEGGPGALRRLAAENPVLVVGRRGCCMCHVARLLLLGLGVNPAVSEIADDASVAHEIAQIAGGGHSGGEFLFPAVFIGGRLVGGLDRLMAAHISGELVPILKEAGALWL